MQAGALYKDLLCLVASSLVNLCIIIGLHIPPKGDGLLTQLLSLCIASRRFPTRKVNGSYYSMIGFMLGYYWENGKENGTYQIMWSHIGVILG